jgi:hypothetical protein
MRVANYQTLVSTVGANSITGCDFNTRGEYTSAPDGCAIDFETGATGFNISGNTIYRSYGGGIMVFGHDKTSHGITLANNIFLDDGCLQPHADRAGIAFMCPNGVKPDGIVAGNRFVTCPGVPAMYDNPDVPGCSANMKKTDNLVNGNLAFIPEPQPSFLPPSPDSTLPSVVAPILCAPPLQGAVTRYTTDGSRPTESSPLVPAKGVPVGFPGPTIAFNCRAFPNASAAAAGLLPSITNGVVIERSRYVPRGMSGMASAVDSIRISDDQTTISANGWVVDRFQAGYGLAPVRIEMRVNDRVFKGIANTSRPDLVPREAPNPNHGFNLSGLSIAGLRGKIVADIFATGTAFTGPRTRLLGSPFCFCDGKPCTCAA